MSGISVFPLLFPSSKAAAAKNITRKNIVEPAFSDYTLNPLSQNFSHETFLEEGDQR